MKKIFRIKGMHCNSCAQLIEDNLRNKVNKISVNFSKGEAKIDFNENKITTKEIKNSIKELGYYIENFNKKSNKVYWFMIFLSVLSLLTLYVILKNYRINIPELNFSDLDNASLFLLFIIGFLTGFHCIAMCGGFLVSYTTKNAIKGHKSFLQHLIYGGSKTVSYTIIGALFGLIGGLFFFSSALRGGIAIFAGIFMIFYSLSMFGFSFFRRFQFNPKFLTKVATKEYSGAYFGPAMTGLLNGLFVACGPLQALYIYAAGTGSVIQGGLGLMAFGLGTLPMMLGFGKITNIISHKATKQILKISAVVVLILGLIMLNRGLALTGLGYDAKSVISKTTNEGITEKVILDSNGYQIIEMKVDRDSWTPDKFILKKDVPVKWIIYGEEITSCNNAIQVPKLNLNFDVKKGKQIVEFTPIERGVISWSCWMGMIPGTFIVIDSSTTQNEIESANKQFTSTEGSCNEGCGGKCRGGCGSTSCEYN
jgi:sulfite exporter TauE/SafE/copper chaperone CopZ